MDGVLRKSCPDLNTSLIGAKCFYNQILRQPKSDKTTIQSGCLIINCHYVASKNDKLIFAAVAFRVFLDNRKYTTFRMFSFLIHKQLHVIYVFKLA